MSTTTQPPVTDLATRLGGIVTPDRQILVDGNLIYCGLDGQVKLQRFGCPVVRLGGWHEVDVVEAAYRGVTS